MSTEDSTPNQLHRAPAADIEDVQVEDEMEQSYIDYAMSVIAGRALPDVRDGLKPVHRRILYAMHEEGVTSGGSHRKSSSVVGDTMGDYHPHGDSAIYDALVRMAQDFSMRHPLIDGQGNFGSIDDDPAAAMRYTEARMSSIGEELLNDIDKDTVDFSSNYDDRLTEPDVLPAAFPNLLVNGSSGIAVGMATDMLPHNLGEVVDALIHRINNPGCEVTDLMDYIKGPDFPTGATILGRDKIAKAYKTGKGRLRVRADYDVEREENRIIVREIPYLKKKAKLVEKIADVVNDESDALDGVTDLRDESDRTGIRIVIDLKDKANIDLVENQLLDETKLETTLSMNNIALVDGTPQRLTLPELLDHYINHRKEVIRRRSEHNLEEAEDRAHILEGRLNALENVDAIVDMIQETDDRSEAIETLQSDFDFSEAQAEHVVRMQLGSLTSMESEEIKAEYEDVQETIDRLETILGDESELEQVVIDDLQRIKDEYDDERRTDIRDDYTQVDDEDLIPEEDVIITVSNEDYIKRMSADTFDPQNRGGKGIIGTRLKDGDHVESVIHASTHDTLLWFTNQGNVYKQKGYKIPEATRNARGTNAVNVLKLDDGERLAAVVPVDEVNGGHYLTMATKNGYVKRTSTEEFGNILSTGIRAIGLEDDDELVGVELTDGSYDVFLATAYGQGIRFPEADIRSMGRTARGVGGVKLEGDDYVSDLAIIPEDEAGVSVFTLTDGGQGKRTQTAEYRTQSRYGKGIKNIRNTEENGPVLGVETVTDDHDVIIITREGQTMRIEADDVSQVGRNTMGVNVITLEDGDDVADFDITG